MTYIRTRASSATTTNPSKEKPTAEGTPKPLIEIAIAQLPKLFIALGVLLLAVLFCPITASAVASGVKFGMLYSIADNGKKSGRADGNVYMRNGRIRGFTMPSLVRSAYTLVQRSNFASLSSGFRALSAVQIAAWNASAGLNVVDRFGRIVNITGKALYIMLNRNLANAGVVAITLPPVFAGAGAMATASNLGAIATGIFKITYTPTPVPAGSVGLVFGTANLGAGISRPSESAYRLIGIIAAGTVSPKDLSTAYTTKNGTSVVGMKIFGRIVIINSVTGESGVPIQFSNVVVA